MRNKLIGDVRNMITGLLKNSRMEPSTGRRNNIGGVPARGSWIPLKNRETALMMHEIAVGCVNASKPVRFGITKFDHRANQGSWFGKRTTSRTRSAPTALWVPARAVLALLLYVVAEGTECVPTWVVLTCGCGSVTEIDAHRRGRTGAALTGIPCEAY